MREVDDVVRQKHSSVSAVDIDIVDVPVDVGTPSVDGSCTPLRCPGGGDEGDVSVEHSRTPRIGEGARLLENAVHLSLIHI